MKSSLSCGDDQAMWTTAHTQRKDKPNCCLSGKRLFYCRCRGEQLSSPPHSKSSHHALPSFVCFLVVHSLTLFLFISHFLHCIQLINQSQAQLSDKFNSAFSHKLATPLISPNLQNHTYAHISTTILCKLTNTSCNDPGHQHKLVSFQQVAPHALYSTSYLSALN